MGKGKAPITVDYELVRDYERKLRYRDAVKRNKAANIAKKRARNK